MPLGAKLPGECLVSVDAVYEQMFLCGSWGCVQHTCCSSGGRKIHAKYKPKSGRCPEPRQHYYFEHRASATIVTSCPGCFRDSQQDAKKAGGGKTKTGRSEPLHQLTSLRALVELHAPLSAPHAHCSNAGTRVSKASDSDWMESNRLRQGKHNHIGARMIFAT